MIYTLRVVFVTATLLLYAGPASAQIKDGSWIRFAGQDGASVSARLELPKGTSGSVPAVILAHSTNGYEPAVARWAKFFREQGAASFELDYFTGRSLTNTSANIPTPFRDLIEAAKVLSTDPRIDMKRIALFGQSRGGNMTIMASDERNEASYGEARIVASVALYPSCGNYINGVRQAAFSAPLLVLLGTKDSFATPDECKRFAEAGLVAGRKVDVIVYPDAYHLFDGDEDRDSRVGAKTISFRRNAKVTDQARNDVWMFLAEPLGLPK